jgi:transcriptional regulator GlxA family with amidase domain
MRHWVELARELLADGRLSLTEVLPIGGFADQSYFTRAFTAIVHDVAFKENQSTNLRRTYIDCSQLSRAFL